MPNITQVLATHYTFPPQRANTLSHGQLSDDCLLASYTYTAHQEVKLSTWYMHVFASHAVTHACLISKMQWPGDAYICWRKLVITLVRCRFSSWFFFFHKLWRNQVFSKTYGHGLLLGPLLFCSDTRYVFTGKSMGTLFSWPNEEPSRSPQSQIFLNLSTLHPQSPYSNFSHKVLCSTL